MLRRRSLMALTAATLLLSAAVGALAVGAMGGGPRPLVLPDVESGALPLLPTADAAARAWRPDAYLVAAAATEGRPPEGRVDPPFLYDTSADPLVGNGRSLAWSYAYASPGEASKLLFVTVGGDGGVLYQRAMADPTRAGSCCATDERAAYAERAGADSSAYYHGSSAPPALPRIALDADEAVSRVVDHPAFADFALDHPVFTAMHALAPGPHGRPAWHVAYRTDTVFSAFAVVDASTGEVLRVDAAPFTGCCAAPATPTPATPVPTHPPEPHPDPRCCAPADRHEEFRVRLGPGMPSHQIWIPVEAPDYARSLHVVARQDRSGLALDEVQMRVTDGEGRPLASEKQRGDVEAKLRSFPSRGVYGVQLSLPAPLREVVLHVRVDLLHNPVPDAAPASYSFRDALMPMGGASHVPLSFPYGATPTHARLEWTQSTGTGGVEVALLDRYGNEVHSTRSEGPIVGTGSATLDVPLALDRECCSALVIRTVGVNAEELRFHLEVRVARAADVHDDVDHQGHVHH